MTGYEIHQSIERNNEAAYDDGVDACIKGYDRSDNPFEDTGLPYGLGKLHTMWDNVYIAMYTALND